MWKSKFTTSSDSLIYTQASSLQKIPKFEGDVREQLVTAASGALDFLEDVSFPPEHKFVEATYRRSIRKGLTPSSNWPGNDRASKLDNMVVRECGTSPDDVRKLEEPEKINMLVEKQRQKYMTPLDKISEFTETFRAFVAHPTSLDEAARVVKTLMFMAHGDDILTNWHCALLDERAVLRRRDQYLEAKNRGEIRNQENFYSGPQGDDRDHQTGKKLTTLLMEAPDLPRCVKQVKGRLSLIGEDDAKLHVDSLLTATSVAQCIVLRGAVKDVENTQDVAHGKIVVVCLVEGELWHVLCNPSHLAMLNPLTPLCLLTLFLKFAPILALGYRQDPSLMPPIKMVESDDGGVVVGNNRDGAMKANVKWAAPITIAQMDTVMARAVKVIGENKISNASARLLAARVASASSSGALASLESRDDGLSNGFGVDVDELRNLIDSMPNIADISKAVGPLGHILCSCPTPPDPPPAPPAPQPTNVNDTDPRNAWTDREWDQFAQQHG